MINVAHTERRNRSQIYLLNFMKSISIERRYVRYRYHISSDVDHFDFKVISIIHTTRAHHSSLLSATYILHILFLSVRNVFGGRKPTTDERPKQKQKRKENSLKFSRCDHQASSRQVRSGQVMETNSKENYNVSIVNITPDKQTVMAASHSLCHFSVGLMKCISKWNGVMNADGNGMRASAETVGVSNVHIDH